MELKEYIKDIRLRLQRQQFTNETAVRQGIVDRILTALGWSTFDTHIVFPEYPVGTGRVDYALCHPPEKPIAFIEAKRVGNIEASERQLFGYASYKGVPILILTDGQKWRFFHSSGSENYTERLVQELDFITDDTEVIADRLNRYLNYASVQTGKAERAIADDYQKVFQYREALRHLPQAWENLVSGISEDSEFLIEAVKSETQRLSGSKPTNEQIFTFLKNLDSQTQPHPNDGASQQSGSRQSSGSPKGERYASYFQALIDEMRERHSFTNDRHPIKGQNYHLFASGASRIKYNARFMREGKVFTGLYINLESYEKNKNFFDILKKRESEINAKFNAPLHWHRREKTCLIGLQRDGTITADANELEAIKAWQIENLLKLKAVLTPEIQLALEKLQSSENEPTTL